MNCRFCNNPLTFEFVDLGSSPPSNSFLLPSRLNQPETFYPLKLYVCEKCFLVQIDEYKKHAEIFDNEYAYFSSYSTSWLKHSEDYVEMITHKLALNKSTQVVEIASNDGYLLQYFKQKNIPCIGIEPTANTAKVALGKGIETIVDFFNEDMAYKLAENYKKADLILGNNVLAHDPNLNGFVKSLKILLKDNGIITMEFPHIMQLILNNQFDTIYHEHFSYFSLFTIIRIFEKHGLHIVNVEELPTHGGSLRIYASHNRSHIMENLDNVRDVLEKEKQMKLNELKGYMGFQEKVSKVKNDLLKFLLKQKKDGKTIAAYGAAAKGNTLLNYCGINKDLIDFVVDASPHKQGKFMPASHIPIYSEQAILENKPDFIVILPWNIKEEIMTQLRYVREWDGKFIITIPNLEIQ